MIYLCKVNYPHYMRNNPQGKKKMADQQQEQEQGKYSLIIGKDDRTADLKVDLLEFFVNGLLSKPCSKRMRSKLDGVYSVENILNSVFKNTNDETALIVSNGTYTVNQKVGVWKHYIGMCLKLFTDETVKQTGFRKSADSPSARELIAL